MYWFALGLCVTTIFPHISIQKWEVLWSSKQMHSKLNEWQKIEQPRLDQFFHDVTHCRPIFTDLNINIKYKYKVDYDVNIFSPIAQTRPGHEKYEPRAHWMEWRIEQKWNEKKNVLNFCVLYVKHRFTFFVHLHPDITVAYDSIIIGWNFILVRLWTENLRQIQIKKLNGFAMMIWSYFNINVSFSFSEKKLMCHLDSEKNLNANPLHLNSLRDKIIAKI